MGCKINGEKRGKKGKGQLVVVLIQAYKGMCESMKIVCMCEHENV